MRKGVADGFLATCTSLNSCALAPSPFIDPIHTAAAHIEHTVCPRLRGRRSLNALAVQMRYN